MSPNFVWHRVRFTQQIERAYVEQMELRVVPLQRLACIIGIAAFAGYQLWDLLLDPQAFPRTAPIRLAIIALFAAELVITFVPSLRRPPYLLMQNIAAYTFVAVGFSLILAQLPNGFLAGVPGFLLGMIFIPVVVIGTVQAVATLTPLVVSPLVVMALAGATRLEIVNAFSWIVGGAGFVIGFAYLLDVINRRAFQLEQLLETEKNRSERLLLNILPADIAERLKAGEEPLADRRDAVTVLFADLVGFTELSRTLRAGDVVDLLNDLFRVSTAWSSGTAPRRSKQSEMLTWLRQGCPAVEGITSHQSPTWLSTCGKHLASFAGSTVSHSNCASACTRARSSRA
jgi:hypothetical protein